MRPSVLLPLLFGLSGAAVLIALGVWQVQRLAWKEAVLHEIETRISATPVELPVDPDPEVHKYLPVIVTGTFDEGALRVLVSRKRVGAGYLVISPLVTGERRILIDRGFLKLDEMLPDAPGGRVTVTGNLHWPDDRNSATPDNDVAGNTWFARDIRQMAETLDTEPVLVVTRRISREDRPLEPLPVDTTGVPNDHLEYAATWFSLAAIWLGMTGYYLWRTGRPAKGEAP